MAQLQINGNEHTAYTRARTYLHNDVKGKVEQQVTDGYGQQVGGKVIRTLYEAVGSSAVREEDDDELFCSSFINLK